MAGAAVLIHAIVQYPVTSTNGNVYTWGPWSEALDPAEYRCAGLTLQEITGFRTGVIGGRSIETRYSQVVSYAIRRCEFDDFLLRRANVRVLDGTPVECAILQETEFEGAGRAAYVNDPDGNLVELWTWDVAGHLRP